MFRDHTEPDHQQIDDFLAYAWSLVDTLLECQASQHLHSDDWQRTIYIDTLGMGNTDFGLDDTKKTALVQSGRDNTTNYFQWYDDPQNHPANRP